MGKNTLREKHKDRVRNCIREGRDLSDMLSKDKNINPLPKNVSKNRISEWIEYTQGYIILPPKLEYRNDTITGIGIYAKAYISAGDVLLHQSNNIGRKMKNNEMEMNDSFISNETPTNINADEINNLLFGALSLVNHACETHCNCLPYYPDREPGTNHYKSSWKTLIAKTPIQKGEQCLISYNKGPQTFSCIQCENVNQKIEDRANRSAKRKRE